MKKSSSPIHYSDTQSQKPTSFPFHPSTDPHPHQDTHTHTRAPIPPSSRSSPSNTRPFNKYPSALKPSATLPNDNATSHLTSSPLHPYTPNPFPIKSHPNHIKLPRLLNIPEQKKIRIHNQQEQNRTEPGCRSNLCNTLLCNPHPRIISQPLAQV